MFYIEKIRQRLDSSATIQLHFGLLLWGVLLIFRLEKIVVLHKNSSLLQDLEPQRNTMSEFLRLSCWHKVMWRKGIFFSLVLFAGQLDAF